MPSCGRHSFRMHPQPWRFGAAGDAVARRTGRRGGWRGMRSLGFNWNFAPVLDVNNNAENPVIAERSFSADPAEVAGSPARWMRGAQGEGVACCIKHFSGHGDTPRRFAS